MFAFAGITIGKATLPLWQLVVAGSRWTAGTALSLQLVVLVKEALIVTWPPELGSVGGVAPRALIAGALAAT